jgi:hypothetical protein
MTVELTAEEKTTVVEQHLKNVAYAQYNATLSLAEAQAVSTPNTENVASLTAQLADLAAQKQILVTELASL